MNLPGNTYYNNAPMYYDVFHQTSGNQGRWDVDGAQDIPSLVDATGAPIPTPIGNGQYSTKAWCGFTRDFSAGNYSLTYDGTGTISFPGNEVKILDFKQTKLADGTVRNTATIRLPGPVTNNGPTDNSWLQVVATFPVTNIQLLSPPEFKVTNSVFRSDFFEIIRPFTTFRFMDAFRTNGNPTQNWSERTVPSAGSRGGTKQGMAYEDAIDIIKVTKKAGWLNVPALATDDYVCRMARLLVLGELGPSSPDAPCNPSAPPTGPFASQHLDASDTIYVEFSNEVWNYGFQQTQDFLCMANLGQFGYDCSQFTGPTSKIAAAALANNSMGWETTTDNKWGRAQQLMFVMAKRVVDIFRTVVSVATSKPTLHTLMNVQFVYPNCYYYAYPFFEKNYGPFGDSFEYYAVAPYFDIDNDTFSGSVDDIFNDLNNYILSSDSTDAGNIVNGIKKVLPFAANLKAKVVAYEGGQGLSGSVNENNKVAAQADPRMYTATQKYLNIWQSMFGNDALFNYFTLAGSYGQYGSWGSIYAFNEHGSQKYDAILSLVATPGDANLDGVVNNLDCAILKMYWQKTNVWWRDADFNHDNIVNNLDLNIMNSHSSPNMCSA